MKTKEPSTPDRPEYSEDEAQRRFEAALLGARAVGHTPMKELASKRHVGKRRRGRPAKPSASSANEGTDQP